MAFRDIKPASTHHYLIVPKRHVQDAKALEPDDAELGSFLDPTFSDFALTFFPKDLPPVSRIAVMAFAALFLVERLVAVGREVLSKHGINSEQNVR